MRHFFGCLACLWCSTNVRRIGYIASEITKHGGICIVANIAPYACDREFNRKLIEQEGGQAALRKV